VLLTSVAWCDQGILICSPPSSPRSPFSQVHNCWQYIGALNHERKPLYHRLVCQFNQSSSQLRPTQLKLRQPCKLICKVCLRHGILLAQTNMSATLSASWLSFTTAHSSPHVPNGQCQMSGVHVTLVVTLVTRRVTQRPRGMQEPEPRASSLSYLLRSSDPLTEITAEVVSFQVYVRATASAVVMAPLRYPQDS
jgi:hypothetical protein